MLLLQAKFIVAYTYMISFGHVSATSKICYCRIHTHVDAKLLTACDQSIKSDVSYQVVHTPAVHIRYASIYSIWVSFANELEILLCTCRSSLRVYMIVYVGKYRLIEAHVVKTMVQFGVTIFRVSCIERLSL